MLLFKFFKLNEELSRGLIPSVLLSGIDLIWQQCSVSLHRVGMTVMFVRGWDIHPDLINVKLTRYWMPHLNDKGGLTGKADFILWNSTNYARKCALQTKKVVGKCASRTIHIHRGSDWFKVVVYFVNFFCTHFVNIIGLICKVINDIIY